MNIQTTRPFERDYTGLTASVQAQVDKQLVLLMSNPQHPSLHLKRIQGTSEIWEVRISRSHRLTLQMAGDTYILRRVGPHAVLRNP